MNEYLMNWSVLSDWNIILVIVKGTKTVNMLRYEKD